MISPTRELIKIRTFLVSSGWHGLDFQNATFRFVVLIECVGPGQTQLLVLCTSCIVCRISDPDAKFSRRTVSEFELLSLRQKDKVLTVWVDRSSVDGLGGLVISPTRELAIQIFEVLRKVIIPDLDCLISSHDCLIPPMTVLFVL